MITSFEENLVDKGERKFVVIYHIRHPVLAARETREGYPAAANAVIIRMIIGIKFPYLS
jgi:hypothetical protein